MGMKIFLTKGKRDYVKSGKYRDDIWAMPLYRFDSHVGKALAQICARYNLKIARWFLGEWARHLDECEYIVLEGLRGRSWAFEYILRNKSDHTRLILWHWNKIFENEIHPESKLAKSCEQWSFDEDDCRQYHMQFNTQYFGTFDLLEDDSEQKKWDIYFCGSDKGRKKLLEKFRLQCEEQNISVYIHLVGDNSSDNNSDVDGRVVYRKPISYEQNLKNVMDSKALLDIPLQGQHGLTLRILEVLYLKRKLITCNKHVKNLFFYDADNILLYDENISGTDIKCFLDKKYKDTEGNKTAREYYSFEAWMERFGRV